MKHLELGLRIKSIRETMRINQSELAKILEIDQGRLSKIEKGQLQFTAKMAYLLATKLNANPNFILGIEQNMFLKAKNKDAILTVDEPNPEYKVIQNAAYYDKLDEIFKLKEQIIQLKTEILELKREKLENNK